MQQSDGVTSIVPAELDQAIDHQRVEYPDDGPALDRLSAYLETCRPLMTEIRAAVSEVYCIAPSELGGITRVNDVALARQVFCYLAYRYTKNSMAVVAKAIGLADHTTVRHAVQKIGKQAITNKLMRDDLDLLRMRIAEKLMTRFASIGRG
jgi:chromosomal replication initiator protein